MPECPRRPLGELVSNHDSRRIPLSSREREARHGIYPYYGAAGIIDYVDAPIFSGLHLLVGEDGSVTRNDGTPYLQLASGEFWVNNHAHVLTGTDEIDTRYLYFALGTINIGGFVTGAVQQKLSQRNMNLIEVPFPTRSARERIVHVLGALDDKVEQNRRTARALEALARATFRAWFVDFEPVRAKADGAKSFPGLPHAAFAALPARLTHSPSGPVPEGWAVRTLAEAFDLNPPRRLSQGQDAPYLDMRNMPTEGHAPDAWERRSHGSGMRFINGDTLVARITPCLENGKTAYIDFLDDGEVAWGSTEYIVLRPKQPLPEIFAYCLARTPEFRDFAIQNMTGTSGRQRVSASVLGNYRIAVPDATTATSFGEVTLPLFEFIRSSKAESSKLVAVRDYLLPRLLSGAARVHPKETL